MNKIVMLIFSFLIIIDLHSTEKNVDKLDILDQQSKDFFKAITGLEKDYLEEQLEQINKKKEKQKKEEKKAKKIENQSISSSIKEKFLTPEEYEREVFRNQSELARLTNEFTKTKMLKDIKIKSIYTFNNNSYVILKLDKNTSDRPFSELSSSIEGRYKRGDNILGHRLVSVNLRTKSIKLYKKLDDKYGYYVYISNYGISVSNLQKRANTTKVKNKTSSKKISSNEKNINNPSSCIYRVKAIYINVRNNNNPNAKILRVLRKNDTFTIEKKVLDWVKIHTIYKKISGDTMEVKDQNNWLRIIKNYVVPNSSNCNN